MHKFRKWLFQTVAYTFTLKGMHGIHVKELAATGGMNVEAVLAEFPDRQALMAGLIDEICAANGEYIAAALQTAATAQERAACYVTGSLDFSENRPDLAEVVVICLLGSQPALKERVHDDYAALYAPMLDDLLAEGAILSKSRTVLADVTEVLLSIVFLGGSPVLQMDYLSFVDPQKVALSTLHAMKRRYTAGRFAQA